MSVSKLFYLLLIFTLFSQPSASQQNNEYAQNNNTNDYEQVVRNIYNNNSIYIDNGIKKSVDAVYKVNLLSYLMETYRYADSVTVVYNDKFLIENLDKNITKQDINNTILYETGLQQDDRQVTLHPAIKGLISHHEALKDPLSKNGAISQAVHLSSENFLDLRKTIAGHVVGFIIFGIVFHFAFRTIVRLKGERTHDGKKSMFLIIEITAFIILLTILSLLVNNKCRDFRINTTMLLSETYNKALAYSYEFTEEDFHEDSDTSCAKGGVSDSDYRRLLRNVKYAAFDVPRYGFAIKYPEVFTDIETSYNGDGGSIKDKWGIASLVTYGIYNVCEWDVDSLARNNHQDNQNITYLRIFRKEKYYIKSGYIGRDTIFYEKGGLITNDGDEINVCARLEYPERFKKDFEPIIKKIFNEFPVKRKYILE